MDVDTGNGKPMVRLLGPIDVLTDHGPVAVGGRSRRAFVGALAVRAGHAVPIDELEEMLWRDGPPSSAGNVVQSYVSHLRHELGSDVVLLTDHSYELNLDVVDIDALEFEGLARRAYVLDDLDDRLHCCHDALALWRGRPFGEFADDEYFELETYRLDALREAVMELSLETELHLGRHDLIVGELESAVREHPYNERLWSLLIVALARGDRRVEALRACAELRRTLGGVGVEVGARIAALERRILDGDRFDLDDVGGD
jgi:DNA-binding SARP family transcriptional activator